MFSDLLRKTAEEKSEIPKETEVDKVPLQNEEEILKLLKNESSNQENR